jgi:spore germination protein GerM
MTMAKKRSSRKKRSYKGFFSAVLLLVGAAGFGYWWSTNKWTPMTVPSRQSMAPTQSPNKVVLHERKNVKVYVLDVQKDESVLVSEIRRVPKGDDPKISALENLIATNRESGDRSYLIPKGTKLLGLHVKDGIAYVDFSREIKDGFIGGSNNESLLVNAIVYTLTQFKDVQKVQILVEGKRVESLGGAVLISEPISGDSTVLGEGEAE